MTSPILSSQPQNSHVSNTVASNDNAIPPHQRADLTALQVAIMLGLGAAAVLKLIGLPVGAMGAAAGVLRWSGNSAAVDAYTAAYAEAAIRRVYAAQRGGQSLENALNNEHMYFMRYRDAVENRNRVRKAVVSAAKTERTHQPTQTVGRPTTDSVSGRVVIPLRTKKPPLGGVLLGWYNRDDAKVSPECRAAGGHNFYVGEGTLIGFPGAVHPHCRCKPGPPHPGGSENMVNDYLKFLGNLRAVS